MVKDIEDEEDETVIGGDEEDNDDTGDTGKESGKTKEEKEPEIEVEIEEEKEEKDERIAVQGRKKEVEETQEEKRARRRRERQAKNKRNYANRRELETVKETLARIAKENEELRAMAHDFGKREASRDEQQIDTAINSQRTLYSTAEAQLIKAISEGDGVRAAEAQRVMNDASNKYNQLTQLKTTAETSRRTAEVNKPAPKAVRDNSMVAVYTNRFLAQNDWFDPSGKDDDSKLAKEIDNEVAAEGYDPNTREYWDEVKKRLREEIPHVFGEKQAHTKPRPKQINGSMGADSSPSNVKSVKIPERVVKMAKDAGYWDDPKMRKIFLNNYKAQNETVG